MIDLVATGLSLALGAASTVTLDLPMGRASGGQPQVEAHTADGRRVPCLLDTGATRSVLAPGLLDPDRDQRLGELDATGAGGTGRFVSWRVRQWRLGPRQLPAFPALAADLGAGTPCVLSLRVLGESQVELDFVDGRLRAGTTSALRRPLPYTAVLGFIRVELPMPDGHRSRWILDTGAGTTVVNRRAAAALGLDPRQPASWADRRGIDGRFRRHRVHALPAWNPLPDGAGMQRVEVAELPVLDRLGIDAHQPGGLLGSDALQGRRLRIDFDEAQLELRR